MKNLHCSEVWSPHVICRRTEEVMVFLYNKGKYLYSTKSQLISMGSLNTPIRCRKLYTYSTLFKAISSMLYAIALAIEMSLKVMA